MILKDFDTVQHLLGHLAGGDVTVLAGRPAMGKSGVGLRIASCTADQGDGVAIYQLEMKKRQMVERITADRLWRPGDGVLFDHIRTGNLKDGERAREAAATKDIMRWPFVMDECPGLTAPLLAAKVRRHKRMLAARGITLRMVIVDYLQLMQPPGRSEGRNSDLSDITRAVKTLAKQEDVHVVLLSQLSRAVEQRDDKRPQLSDLRDSGAIEQDADNVVFAYREHYYLSALTEPKDDAKASEWRADIEACKNELELICRKRRQGATGTQRCNYYLEYQAIRDLPRDDRGWI